MRSARKVRTQCAHSAHTVRTQCMLLASPIEMRVRHESIACAPGAQVNILLFASSAWHLGRKIKADYIDK